MGVSNHTAPPATIDTADEGQLFRSHCPADFVPVPYDNPEFCIMAYEASHYQNRAISVSDVVPAMNISFWRARELCENMRLSDPPSCANPRLASWEEWRDAGDGQLGEGGLLYPWGDDADAERCVLPSSSLEWDGPQPTGSLQACVSSFGVYDQIGNLWEWVDEQKEVSVARWLDARSAGGIELELVGDRLRYIGGDLAPLHPHIVSFSFLEFVADENGFLSVLGSEIYPQDGPMMGHLMVDQHISELDERHFLPIRLVFDETWLKAELIVELERDGEPIVTKVGGAYYSGGDATLKRRYYGHVPEFDGSIGFRCTCTPE